HPNFGVFMSDYDVFIHKNFFPDPAMVALVVDQMRGQAGWFSGRDEVRQIGSYQIEPSSTSAPDGAATAVRPSASRGGTGLLVAAASVVGAFALGWVLAPDSGEPVDQVVAPAEDAELTTALEERARD